MNEVLDNRLGGLSLPRKSVVRLTDRPDMTLDVYRGRKTTMQQQQQHGRGAGYVCVSGRGRRWREQGKPKGAFPVWGLFIHCMYLLISSFIFEYQGPVFQSIIS